MHGAHGHFVDLAALHAVVVALGRAGTLRARGGRGVGTGLSQGWPSGHDAPGLVDLTLEALELGGTPGSWTHSGPAAGKQEAPQFLLPVMGHDAAQTAAAVLPATSASSPGA